jgi:hypothetical protein
MSKSKSAAPANDSAPSSLPPWLLPLSALGVVLHFKHKPTGVEAAVELSRGGVIVISVPDHPEGAMQVSRALEQAGKILTSHPAKPPRQLELGDAARPGAGHD